MGYEATAINYKFNIEEENKERGMKLILELMDKAGELGSGGYFSNDKEERLFSWVSTDVVQQAITLEQMFAAWGWIIEEGALYQVHDGNKLGDEEHLFSAVAPVVEDESFVEMIGEDGCRWRWAWLNGKLYRDTARIKWFDGWEQNRGGPRRAKGVQELQDLDLAEKESIAKYLVKIRSERNQNV